LQLPEAAPVAEVTEEEKPPIQAEPELVAKEAH
jgi:hypothetical protein